MKEQYELLNENQKNWIKSLVYNTAKKWISEAYHNGINCNSLFDHCSRELRYNNVKNWVEISNYITPALWDLEAEKVLKREYSKNIFADQVIKLV